MNLIFFSGNLGRDAEVRDASDTTVCNFSVAVKQGIGRDAETEWYRCELWGKRGEAIAEYLRKGDKVAVVGDLVIEEYEGKPQYRVRVHEVDFMSSTGGEDRSDSRRSSGRTERDDDRGSRRREPDRRATSRGREPERSSRSREIERDMGRRPAPRSAALELDDDVPF